MRLYLTFAFCLLLFCPQSVSAQRADDGGVIVLSPQELQDMIRRMAAMKRRRQAMLRRRADARPQARPPRYAQDRYEDRAMPRRAETERRVVYDTVEIIDPKTYRKSVVLEERRTAEDRRLGTPYRYDTIIQVDPRNYSKDTIIVANLDRKKRGRRRAGAAEDNRSTGRGYAEDDDLRRRLDRHEAELRDLQRRLDGNYDRDYENRNYDQRDRDDRDRRNPSYYAEDREIERLNREIRRLEDDLDRERERRRLAEDRRYDDRGPDYDRRYADQRDEYYRQRELEIQRKQRELDRLDRPVTPPARPGTTIVPPAPPAPPRVLRDTVYVDRVREVPATPAPGRVDTVVMVKEREVAQPVVVQTERVVERDTVRVAAREPMTFPTVFFDNNSSTLNANHRRILQEVGDELYDRRDYRVVLTGYASKSGNAEYNQQLSARRAKAVSDGLVAVGISADRIRIIPGGIDYQPASPAAARRVEVKAVPR